MNVLGAASKSVSDYPGGAESLAPLMCMSAAILRNKLNPNNHSNQLSVLEAEEIMTFTGSKLILQAMAANQDCAVSEIGMDAGAGDDTSIMSLVLSLGAAEGDFSHVLHDALADSVISTNDMKAITNASLDDQRALIKLVARLHAAVKQATPDRP